MKIQGKVSSVHKSKHCIAFLKYVQILGIIKNKTYKDLTLWLIFVSLKTIKWMNSLLKRPETTLMYPKMLQYYSKR